MTNLLLINKGSLRCILVLLFLTIGLTQDEYPYFSDPQKQFKFEEKRIYVLEESKEQRHTYGGGSKRNPWHGIIPNEPLYIKSNISTSYTYKYTFQMIQSDFVRPRMPFYLVLLVFQSVKDTCLNGMNVEKTRD